MAQPAIDCYAMNERARLLPLLAALCLAACAAGAGPADPASPVAAAAKSQQEESVLVGPVTREQVEQAVPEWVKVEGESSPDAEAARALAGVEPGAELIVFLGTWCGDSRREVPRFWRALDLAGPAVPFEVHYIGVDEDKKEPSAPVTNNGIQYVPTFIVRRNGQEVGRIVEDAPGGIEKDLLSLLTGQSKGLISSRSELQSPGSPPPQPPR